MPAKDDIGRHLNMVERRTRPLVEAALATAAKMQWIAQAGRLVTTDSDIFGMTMRALHHDGCTTMP